ncbi:hypothetical protein AMTR_s00019p00137390 [Amborella trichopoda]|uniref:Uncharacterized protein n=1 Tax=Amborella trichopoda TaxID=13333 RepID=W1PB74_AMBTC|nr:hypothetical protein AMTR_s00019p00137390 [Amborella trichopoda]
MEGSSRNLTIYQMEGIHIPLKSRRGPKEVRGVVDATEPKKSLWSERDSESIASFAYGSIANWQFLSEVIASFVLRKRFVVS